MNTTAKELALGGMFTALGVVLLCLGGVVPLALYACPILASAVLLPVRERCRKQVAWSCYAAIALLGTLLGPDKEASMLFVFLGYYPLVKPKLDAIHSRALRLTAKLLLAVFAVGADYLFLLFVLRLDAVTQELAGTAPAILWATCALGLALFFLYDLTIPFQPHSGQRVPRKAFTPLHLPARPFRYVSASARTPESRARQAAP